MIRFVATFLLALLLVGSTALSGVTDRFKLRWLRDKPTVGQITVVGTEFFSASEVEKRMYSRERSFWGTLKGDRRTRIQRESLGRDTLEIKYLYLTNGFLGIQVEEDFDIILPDSSAHVLVSVAEGRRFFYGEADYEYPEGTPFVGDFTGIGRRLKPGKPVNLFELRQATFDMKAVLANGGYPYASVDYLLDTLNGSEECPVVFRIRPDSLVRFGNVDVTGIRNYPVYTARRESRIKTGEDYRRQDIIDTQRRLLESGYFTTVNIDQDADTTDRLQPDFILRVRERKPRYLTLQTGAGQSVKKDLEWDITGSFGKRNFFGSRRYDLTANAKFDVGGGRGLLEHVYRVSFTEPWLLGTRTPLVLSAEYEPGVKDPEQNFRIESWSLSASTIRKFGEAIRIDLGLEYESVRIYGVPADEVELLKESEGISVRRKMYVMFRRDSRDNIFVPRRGSLTNLEVDYYGGFLGGDDNFSRLEASWSSYQVVWPGWVSATRFKSGWVQPFSPSKEVPLNDRFYLGGANTIRGFEVNTLGPTLPDGTLEKANFIAVFNQEFRWQTIQIFQFIPLLKGLLGAWPLWQSVFFDMGNGFRKVEEMSFDRLAYSYGTGLQIVSPAGPIRLDYARRIPTEDIDFDTRWHFTILYAF